MIEQTESRELRNTGIEVIQPLTHVVIRVKPEDDPSVVALTGEALKLRDYAVARVIATDADLPGATNDLALMASLKKALTEKKAEYTK